MNTKELIHPFNIVFRCVTQDDVNFVAWSNYTASSPAPGFCWLDTQIEG